MGKQMRTQNRKVAAPNSIQLTEEERSLLKVEEFKSSTANRSRKKEQVPRGNFCYYAKRKGQLRTELLTRLQVLCTLRTSPRDSLLEYSIGWAANKGLIAVLTAAAAAITPSTSSCLDSMSCCLSRMSCLSIFHSCLQRVNGFRGKA